MWLILKKYLSIKNYHKTAMGGTFNFLHIGHKMMLSLASLVSRDITIGITGKKLLE